MLLRHAMPVLLFAVVATALPVSAMADPPQARQRGESRPPRDEPRGQQGSQPRRDDALSDSVRRIERSTRGQVLRAERMQADGRDVNRIKVVDEQGRVRVYLDDPGQPPPPPRTRDNDD